MIFKRLLSASVIALGLMQAKADSQSTAVAKPALLITLKPAASAFELGKPIDVHIFITNTSKNVVTLEVQAPHPAYHLFDFTLTSNGTDIAETALHRSIKNRSRPGEPPVDLSLRSILVDIPPGDTKVYEANMAELFKLEANKSYSLVVSMPADPVSGARIASSTLPFTTSK